MTAVVPVYMCPESGTFHQVGDYWGISERFGFDCATCAYCGQRMWSRSLPAGSGMTHREYARTRVAFTEEFLIDEEPF